MAFIPSIALKDRLEDAKTAFLKDVTGNYGDKFYVRDPASGLYNEVVNSNGYGVDTGVSKSSVARIVFGIYRDKKKSLVLPEPYLADQESDEFTFEIEKDGIYTFRMLLIPIGNGSGAGLGEAWFELDGSEPNFGGKIMQMTQQGPVQVLPTEVHTADLSGIFVTEDRIEAFASYAIRAYNDIVYTLGREELGEVSCDTHTFQKLKQKFEILLTGFVNDVCEAEYSTAQRKAIKLQELTAETQKI